MKREDIAANAVLATCLAWSPPEVERERHARELGVSWCSACGGDHAPDAPCQPRVEPRPCCHKRCSLPVVDGTSRCEKHTVHHRAEQARRSRSFRAAGRCGLCGADAVPGKARCSTHDSSIGAHRCGVCRELGHNRLTCTQGRAS